MVFVSKGKERRHKLKYTVVLVMGSEVCTRDKERSVVSVRRAVTCLN